MSTCDLWQCSWCDNYLTSEDQLSYHRGCGGLMHRVEGTFVKVFDCDTCGGTSYAKEIPTDGICIYCKEHKDKTTEPADSVCCEGCAAGKECCKSPTPSATGFVKNDTGKNQLDLIAPHFEWALGMVLTKGAVKYSRGNYLKGADWSRYAAAAKRHINQWLRGEDIDDGPDGTGESHLANAAACLQILFESQRLGIGRDDRHEVHGGKRVNNGKAFCHPERAGIYGRSVLGMVTMDADREICDDCGHILLNCICGELEDFSRRPGAPRRSPRSTRARPSGSANPRPPRSNR